MSATAYLSFRREVQGENSFLADPDPFAKLDPPNVFVVESGEKYLTEAGFSNLICSRRNSICDPARKEKVFQDMSLPLTHYWIATSHNTYLEGDQLFGNS